MIFVGLNILRDRSNDAILGGDLHDLPHRPGGVLCNRIPDFDAAKLTNIAPDAGQTSFLPFGWAGIFAALPFAIWFYLAIEELPLAAEESMDPKRDVPRGTMWGLWTLVIAAMGVLFLNTGVTGAEEIRTAGEPLLDGFRVVLGSDTNAAVLGLFALTGLIASFHTIIYAYGRNIYSLSRAGYFPHWMSVTHGKRKTPYVALLLGGVVGYGLASLLALRLHGHGRSRPLEHGGVRGGHLILHADGLVHTTPSEHAQHRTALSEPGRGVRGRSDGGDRPDLAGGVVPQRRLPAGGVRSRHLVVLGILYFGLSGRNKLVLFPQEEFAMTLGEHGNPEKEGYGTTSVADTTA